MTNSCNIKYTSNNIEDFYKNNRTKWEDFYPSEQYIFDNIGLNRSLDILDIGCACGGLGNALKKRFGILKYTGIDINEKAILTGKNLYPEFTLLTGDILYADILGLHRNQFDVVFSLSCIDWNIEFDRMLSTAMNYLKPNGKLVVSFRLTNNLSLTSIEESFQYVNFNNKLDGEKAPYVIMNYYELMKKIGSFFPKSIQAYGYFGKPSSTAVTPYNEVCFSVFSITKGPADICEYQINLPSSMNFDASKN